MNPVMTDCPSKPKLALLDLLFPPHPDAPVFLAVCEMLDGEGNPLSSEERIELYRKAVEHFHCLGRNYTAFWRHVGTPQIDVAVFGRSLYNVVLTRYGQPIDTMPTEVAEMNYELTDIMKDPHRARAMSLFMTEMLRELHQYPPAKLSS
jgi:hypothetical protein